VPHANQGSRGALYSLSALRAEPAVIICDVNAVPTVRPTARVLLVDTEHRVLLFEGIDETDPSRAFWFPPGGGIEPGEGAREAAIREVREETGLADLHLGPHIWNRSHVVTLAGVLTEIRETWFLAQVPVFEIDTSEFTELESRTIRDHRWWTQVELATTRDVLVPQDLAPRLQRLIDLGPPSTPLTIGI